MTAFLKIDGKEHEAKCTFRFSKLADKKYSKKKEKDSDPDNGFGSIFGGLIEFDNTALVAFWDCALDYAPKDNRKSKKLKQRSKLVLKKTAVLKTRSKKLSGRLMNPLFSGNKCRNIGKTSI